MSQNTTQTLGEVLTISRNLAQRATEGDWDEVASLESQQRDLLERYLSVHGDQVMTPDLAAILSDVRIYTDTVLELAKRQRTTLTAAVQKISKGKRAVTAYNACTT